MLLFSIKSVVNMYREVERRYKMQEVIYEAMEWSNALNGGNGGRIR